MRFSLASCRLLLPALAALLARSTVDAKAVFAHFMVGNVQSYSVADWESDITLAQEASIDGFALNIGAGDGNNAGSIAKGFQAAENKGFKLFFSFDYLGGSGAWAQGDVIALVNQYKSSQAYWNHEGTTQPLVSTFEGTSNTGDWTAIKAATGAFFIPDWSSMGPQAAAATGVVDGLFSWAAWPDGASDMTTAGDEAYVSALGGKPYMMPVSPWFYTNLPGWGKNWVWRGDDLWFDRWQQVLALQPDLVEIVTWNDYGESHYIGPVCATCLGLFQYGGAPFDYASGMPHDAWRKFLPQIIASYKAGRTSIEVQSAADEGVTVWHRPNPAAACGDGGTTGNSAQQGQQTTSPGAVLQDRVFFTALLASAADVVVSIGGHAGWGVWESTPAGGAGLYHGSVPFDGRVGNVSVSVLRSGQVVTQAQGGVITSSCTAGVVNWNAWVGSS